MARKLYKIEVTDLDIQQAIRNDSYRCVVAQAIARTIPEATRILVDLQTIRFTLDDHRLQYLTGTEVASYVVGFDAGDPIEPFAFTLRKPRVTRRSRKTGDPAAPKAQFGSPEHRAKAARTYAARRKSPETFPLVGANGDVTHEEVLSAKRAAPVLFRGIGRARHYGHRLLRINRDRFAPETERAAAAEAASTPQQ